MGLRRLLPAISDRVEHFAGLAGGDSTTHEPGENHRQRLPNELGATQKIERVFGEGWRGSDAGHAGAAELLVEVAVRAGPAAGDWQRRPMALVWRQNGYSEILAFIESLS